MTVVQLALAGGFFLFGYSLTSSIGRGRPPAMIDIALLALPVVAVLVGAIAARALCRAGKPSAAGLGIWLPLPISFLAYMLLGAI